MVNIRLGSVFVNVSYILADADSRLGVPVAAWASLYFGSRQSVVFTRPRNNYAS